MITDEMLTDARKRAEAAVADMPTEGLRTAAFSVILAHLLTDRRKGIAKGGKASRRPFKPARRQSTSKAAKSANSNEGLGGRLVGLREDGFFADQRSLAEVRDELKKHGWHYPLTSLSGPMQKLVRDRELRREQVPDGSGKKKVWKYSTR